MMTTSRFLRWLIPSPFSNSTFSKPYASSDNIAVLDGLRGIACLFVLHEHWTCAVDDVWLPYALGELATGLMWNPFVILLWGGQAMVNLFFVISGYVLSCRPLRLLHSEDYQKMYEGIASSLFRRTFRLLLPTMAAIMLVAALTQLRAFEPARLIFDTLNTGQAEAFEATTNVTRLIEAGIVPGGYRTRLLREDPPPMAKSLFEQGIHAFKECSFLFKNSAAGEASQQDIFVYDKHVWTIPVELHSSMVLLILVMGTSMLTSGWRLFLHGTVLLFFVLQGYRSIGLFIGGMMTAEIDIIGKHFRFEHASTSRKFGPLLCYQASPYNTSLSVRRFDAASTAWSISLIAGLYFLSVPFIEPVTASPYVFLAELLPDYVAEKNRLIRLIGAIMTTWSCVHSSIVGPVLKSSIAQYLGKISFALYLTHGLLIRSLGYVVIGRLRGLTGASVREDTSVGQFVFIWVCGYIIMLPSFLWTADLFWRSIDAPSVRLARWIEQRFSRPEWKPRNKGVRDTAVFVG